MNLRIAHYVGRYLKHERLYLCVAYDPNVDYFVCAVDNGPNRMADISTRAIGRTFHETYDMPFPSPDTLVAAVEAALWAKPMPPVDHLSADGQRRATRVYDSAADYWKRCGRGAYERTAER
jgi:hypothetical protein